MSDPPADARAFGATTAEPLRRELLAPNVIAAAGVGLILAIGAADAALRGPWQVHRPERQRARDTRRLPGAAVDEHTPNEAENDLPAAIEAAGLTGLQEARLSVTRSPTGFVVRADR